MIILRESEFIPYQDKFKLPVIQVGDWNYFIDQYHKTLKLLNDTALKHRYRLNSKSYPYLFLLRHYCELKLKGILAKRSIMVPISHNFQDILPLLADAPLELKKAIDLIRFDNDGSCFRYLYDKNRNLGPLYGKIQEIAPFYEMASKFENIEEYAFNLGIVKPIDRRTKYDLQFHFNEIVFEGQFRSTYDDMTTFLINSIIEEKINAEEIYLPLLYLIRHSVELALKSSLLELLHTVPQEKKVRLQRLINNEHKLSKLYNKYIDCLPEDRLSNLPNELQTEYNRLKAGAEILKTYIHSLDTNSRAFTFPGSEASSGLNLEQNSLIDIITIFLRVDAFLTFNVELLKEHDLIPFSDEEIAERMGYSPYYE